VAEWLPAGRADVSLVVAREGFSLDGSPVGTAAPGVVELADALTTHGVAGIMVIAPPTADEVLGFVEVLARPIDEVKSMGGFDTLLTTMFVQHLRAVEVNLTASDAAVAPDSVEIDLEAWLQDLGSDADKLATWFASASGGDPAVFEDGLVEIARAAGDLGAGLFDSALSAAFLRQGASGKDALLMRAGDSEQVRELVGRMFRELSPEQIAEALTSGVLGRNMLSLSNALTSLPLGSAAQIVHLEVARLATESGHSPKEIAFLDHMVETRLKRDPEAALVDRDQTYRNMRDATIFEDSDVLDARGVVVASETAINRAGIRTMLALLDQQDDFALYCDTVDALVAMTPGLIEAGELGLARRVLQELAHRQSGHTAPWPELTQRLEAALATASDARTMRAVLSSVLEDHSRFLEAREILTLLGEGAAPALVREAIILKDAGIEAAERLIGSTRLLEQLSLQAQTAEWHQLEPIVARIAREHDGACMKSVQTLLGRPDGRSRREVARGLARVAAPAPSRLLALGLRDEDNEVATIVAHGVARCGVPGSAELLNARLEELNIDGADFPLARELIGALAMTPESAAGDVLDRLASRKSLMKRGHFMDVQAVVAKAQQQRASGGVGL